MYWLVVACICSCEHVFGVEPVDVLSSITLECDSFHPLGVSFTCNGAEVLTGAYLRLELTTVEFVV